MLGIWRSNSCHDNVYLCEHLRLTILPFWSHGKAEVFIGLIIFFFWDAKMLPSSNGRCNPLIVVTSVVLWWMWYCLTMHPPSPHISSRAPSVNKSLGMPTSWMNCIREWWASALDFIGYTLEKPWPSVKSCAHVKPLTDLTFPNKLSEYILVYNVGNLKWAWLVFRHLSNGPSTNLIPSWVVAFKVCAAASVPMNHQDANSSWLMIDRLVPWLRENNLHVISFAWAITSASW